MIETRHPFSFISFSLSSTLTRNQFLPSFDSNLHEPSKTKVFKSELRSARYFKLPSNELGNSSKSARWRDLERGCEEFFSCVSGGEDEKRPKEDEGSPRARRDVCLVISRQVSKGSVRAVGEGSGWIESPVQLARSSSHFY
ncbi:hypothetical protein COLO4_34250 [Corchorus olitorius]|uniref:Uncharacterized protein n=1 Tax=Corchorus olitorius TaxID=93759 RepID=A0A1R3GMI9_9ROSI|nr:hypothetical protein COLO4_34250 [Corchorus olitorius]